MQVIYYYCLKMIRYHRASFDGVIEMERCYVMEINVEKTKVMKISRQPRQYILCRQ
jgi:isopentenyldiphosphate isomerase